MEPIREEYILCLNIPMFMIINSQSQNTDHVLWTCMTFTRVTDQIVEVGHAVAAAV